MFFLNCPFANVVASVVGFTNVVRTSVAQLAEDGNCELGLEAVDNALEGVLALIQVLILDTQQADVEEDDDDDDDIEGNGLQHGVAGGAGNTNEPEQVVPLVNV